MLDLKPPPPPPRHTDRDKWWVSFGSDVAANLLNGSAAWLARKVFGR